MDARSFAGPRQETAAFFDLKRQESEIYMYIYITVHLQNLFQQQHQYPHQSSIPTPIPATGGKIGASPLAKKLAAEKVLTFR